jgi:hypothetical protein
VVLKWRLTAWPGSPGGLLLSHVRNPLHLPHIWRILGRI